MKLTPHLTFTGLLAAAPMAGAALTNYWPLNETSGTSAANSAAGGAAASLFTGASWVNDPTRGPVLEFDGVDGYATAGQLPPLASDASFTWSFWANSGQSATDNNNILLGNRFPDQGWVKFTPRAFEYRDITPTFDETLDYDDLVVNTWMHHAVVKNGRLFTYYRNGVAQRNNWTTGDLPADTPLYFGGDTTNENWAGRLDDVATWNNAMSTQAIAGIFSNKYTPATAPAAETIPTLVTVFSDNFSGDLFSKWNLVDRGLENTANGGYDEQTISAGAAVLGGTTNAQYWLGSSLETLDTFDSRIYSEVSVNRVSLTGSGSAYRSSVWIYGDAAHYLHLSQNIGENGWSFNARDDGGAGTYNPTGSGNNLEGMDPLDSDGESHTIKFRILPTGLNNGINIEMQIDGVAQAVHGFTNFPETFKVVLTGQARATGDMVSAVFDDVTVAKKDTTNQLPVFDAASHLLPTATVGTPYSQSIADLASDPDGDTLIFSKISGPTWLNVAANGSVSGNAEAGITTANVVVRASDPNGGETTTALLFRVNNPAAPQPPFFGWWPLNEGAGTFGADISGGGNRATITNAASGGLGEDNSVWATDPDYGKVISFNGNDGVDAGWAVVGNPPAGGTLPILDGGSSFTWSFWAKPEQTANNDIIVGNRFNAAGADFGVVQFTKFTGSNFEWYFNGTAQHIDYPDPQLDVWAHHVVVKDGDALFYYLDGVLTGGRTISVGLTEAMPLYFGGGANGVEAWNGYLHDVRLFNGALSETGVAAIHADRGNFSSANPTFTASYNLLPTAPSGKPLSVNLASQASDPQNDPLVFTKISGPDWASVSSTGTLSGTPDGINPLVSVVIKAADPGNNSATATFAFRVEDPTGANPPLFGAWPLDDGTGTTARDVSSNGFDAEITNADTGGLSDSGSAWLADPERGTVLSFAGTDGSGAWATVGSPPGFGDLPLMDLGNRFTWAFWAKPDQTASNAIILGNRYNPSGVDYGPAQFIKFTSSKFEWYLNGVNQGIDYPDLEQGIWAHHAIVKDGNSLFYYRNGTLSGQQTITINPAEAMPVYFGGGFNGVESWRGALSDVNLYDGALTEGELTALATAGGGSDGSLVITSVSLAPNRAITLQWNGEVGKTYVISASKTTSGFVAIGESATNSWTFQPGNAAFNTATESRLFFRVAEKAGQ